MCKASFYNTFKRVNENLTISNESFSFSLQKELASSLWNDNIGRKASYSFNKDNSRFVSDLSRQFENLKSIDKQLPDNGNLSYQEEHCSIIQKIESCIARE